MARCVSEAKSVKKEQTAGRHKKSLPQLYILLDIDKSWLLLSRWVYVPLHDCCNVLHIQTENKEITFHGGMGRKWAKAVGGVLGRRRRRTMAASRVQGLKEKSHRNVIGLVFGEMFSIQILQRAPLS